MPFTLSPASLAKLAGVHPDLQRVVRRAITITTQDFIVVQGVRTRDEMCVNWGKGRTAAQCEAVQVPARYAQPTLAKVTWLRDPFMSNHRQMPDGFGHAVDLGAIVDGKYDGAHRAPYEAIAKAMLDAAKAEGVGIRWLGANGGQDLAHFELTGA